MKRCRLLRAGGMLEVSPLVLECVREAQRTREPDARAMIWAEDWATRQLAAVVADYRARRRRRLWAR